MIEAILEGEMDSYLGYDRYYRENKRLIILEGEYSPS